ncbi:YIP1 family protein [Gracilibacillus oryzae]|uniref:YIP1 family protein n=1 Tax=Gracilibacillus oryzae TaxID=1672701 RepID=A0A7C8KM76_9BACI|nr:YIP1 family protein [Gracilibacillus oryzae]KAB8125808.1 YIP1 family protein [Gracilibacillus oryzae]
MEWIKFPIFVCFHPFKGFWELKYEEKGRISIAFLFLFCLTVVAILKRQFTGFIVNFNNPTELNSIAELQYIVLPFILWCIANWSITTLMEGEGKFKEIIMATAYALVPLISLYIISTLISLVITWEEAPLYFFLETIATIWFLFLLFIGIMTVHQYTVTKTVVTFALTVIVIAVMLFLGLLIFSLIQQMVSFVETIYRELLYRM